MALAEHKIPTGVNFLKLSSFPDGEIIHVAGGGIEKGTKYGDQPYFVGADGSFITLPGRYLGWMQEVLEDVDAVKELESGAYIRKSSYEYDTGKFTASFDWASPAEGEG